MQSYRVRRAVCVLSIEHGSFATAQTFRLMKSHGTYLVPTLTVYEIDERRRHPLAQRRGDARQLSCASRR